ncbi:major facilitator superfamily domain-containing protein [Aspergillus transmontanensis]|uniref:Major facilitator superfamily domain-containing protein n=1 Tax=Aspergillus transmontanensis TaxID=1034304 RepID=A0A5N6VNR0_9EURO|nr:major facilitator superfamily domain-containing protein [Aspergillus transmontanensis]
MQARHRRVERQGRQGFWGWIAGKDSWRAATTVTLNKGSAAWWIQDGMQALTHSTLYGTDIGLASPVVGVSGPSATMIVEPSSDPYSWTTKKRLFVFVTGLVIVLNSTLGSALPSGAIDFIAADFNITNQQQLVLPIPTYLIGYILGPMVFAPLSETYSRRPVMIWTFLGYTIFSLACAVAPNFAAIVIFRLLSGIFASSPTAVVGGLYADIFSDP